MHGLQMLHLRHAYASKLFARGSDLRLIASMLGHSTSSGIRMTRRYANLTEAAFEQVLKIFEPPHNVVLVEQKRRTDLTIKLFTAAILDVR